MVLQVIDTAIPCHHWFSFALTLPPLTSFMSTAGAEVLQLCGKSLVEDFCALLLQCGVLPIVLLPSIARSGNQRVAGVGATRSISLPAFMPSCRWDWNSRTCAQPDATLGFETTAGANYRVSPWTVFEDAILPSYIIATLDNILNPPEALKTHLQCSWK